MIETEAYWVGKNNGNHGNCTGVLCRCSVCGHEHTFFAYSLEPCANCGRTMMGMKNVPFKRELVVPRDISPEALNLAEQVLTMVQEQLKERSLKMSTLKPLGDDEWHTVLRAVGTNEIDRVIEDVRYQLKCEVCNIRVEDWVTVELDPDDVHQIDMQFSYCPKCGTPLGKKLYLNRREQALNSIYAVSGADTCDSIRVVTDFGIIALRVNEPFYLQKNRYRVSVATNRVSDKSFYNVEICRNNMWQLTVISKSTMAECLLTLAKKLRNREEIVK